VEEVAEYVTEPDPTVARAAVAAIGKLGVRVPSCGGAVVEQLLKLLEVSSAAPMRCRKIGHSTARQPRPCRADEEGSGSGGFP